MSELIEKRLEQSGERLQRLKARKKRCVCKYCGHELKLRRIIYTSFEEARTELYCNHCKRIEYGVEWQTYQSAKFYVEHSGINLYPGLDDNEQCKQINIAKIAEIMDWVCHNLGVVGDEGFVVPLNFQPEFMAECITVSDADLANIDDDEEIEDLYAAD